MSQITEMITTLQTAPYSEKKQFLEYLCRMAEADKRQISHEDRNAIIEMVFAEVEQMRRDIPDTATYREKDLIFECTNSLFGILWFLNGPPANLPEAQQMKIKALASLIKQERHIETTLDEIFQQPSVTETDINRLLYWMKGCTDEYQKGKLFLGLGHQELSRLSEGARQILKEYMAAELRRLMAVDTEDAWNALEVLADVSRYFADEAIVYGLLELLGQGRNHISCYVMDTLCFLGEDVPQSTIDSLAADLEYAHFAYQTLQLVGKTSLFPAAYAAPEYLAKSALVHWLTYPTELGKIPDEIAMLGKIKFLFKKEPYYIFKFRSDSDTLDDENKNKWLIGWSTVKGDSFSHFHPLAAFEGATLEETLKRIKKTIK
ncbi:MAG: hypothetical protein E7447_00925 [Ruminococcaceae bacterium]|nr:hypothetical protein [Oscillospiraceae bacterium]